MEFLKFSFGSPDTGGKPNETGGGAGNDMLMEHDTNSSPRILVAVDDPDLRRVCVAGLRAASFNVSAPTDGDAAMLLAQSFSPDVFVVDLRICDPDGTPLHDRLRDTDEQYLLCVTYDDQPRVRTSVLQHGADDIMSAPIHADELAARCQAMLRRPRRTGDRPIEPTASNTMLLGPLSVDLGRREVRVEETEVQTTRIEFSLLEQLCRRPAEVCTREDLLDAVWGPRWVGDTHVVDVHLSNLRRKLDKASPGLKVIHTVRGVGFRLSNDVTDALESPMVLVRPTA